MTRSSLTLILVLLGCAVPLATVIAHAEPKAGPPKRLYAMADSDRIVRSHQEATRASPAHAEFNSPPAHGDLATDDAQPATTSKPVSAPQGVVGLGAEDRPEPSDQPPTAGQREWIAVLASLGLLSSLAVAVYLAWSRARAASVPVTVLMPQRPPQASNAPSSVPRIDRDERHQRKAA